MLSLLEQVQHSLYRLGTLKLLRISQIASKSIFEVRNKDLLAKSSVVDRKFTMVVEDFLANP
jgi:hypothetical protein